MQREPVRHGGTEPESRAGTPAEAGRRPADPKPQPTQAPPAASGSPPSPAGIDTSDPDAVWTLALQRCTRQRVKFVAQALRLKSLKGDLAVLDTPQSKMVLAEMHASDLTGLLREALGRPVRVEFRVAEGPVQPLTLAGASDGDQQTSPDDKSSPDTGANPETQNAAPGEDPEQHPLVKQTAELFGARVTRIQKRPR